MNAMVPIALDDLPLMVKSRAEGRTKIAQVRKIVPEVRDQDDGRTTVVLAFVLADPPAGMDTWPVDELWELRSVAGEVVPGAIEKALAEVAAKRGTTVDDLPAFGWAIEFRPEHMPPIAPDDEHLVFEV